jgi:hypothetical protein
MHLNFIAETLLSLSAE